MEQQNTTDDHASLVIRHLLEINAGKCSITRDAILRAEADPTKCEILTGLLYLHEDLVFRDAQRVRAEATLYAMVEELAAQNRELERSRAAIAAMAAELATPIIKTWSGVLMMPLVGNIDASRAAEITDRLLASVVREQALHVIVDFSGVPAIERETATHFVTILEAVALLGIKVVLASPSPTIGLAMVSLGIDLSGVELVRSVQEALIHCMSERTAAPSS